MPLTHEYRWKKHRPDLFGRPCGVLARGRLNSVLVRFAGGEEHIVSRFALRRIGVSFPRERKE